MYFPAPTNNTSIIVENAGYARIHYTIDVTTLTQFENVINITMTQYT